MKDLTVVQTANQLRKLFPNHTCYANLEAYSYDHHNSGEPANSYKKIYVADIPDLTHIEGPSFKILIRVAKLISVRFNYAS